MWTSCLLIAVIMVWCENMSSGNTRIYLPLVHARPHSLCPMLHVYVLYCTARSYSILGNLAAKRRYRKESWFLWVVYTAHVNITNVLTSIVLFRAYELFRGAALLVKTTSAEWVQMVVLVRCIAECVCEAFALLPHELCYRYYSCCGAFLTLKGALFIVVVWTYLGVRKGMHVYCDWWRIWWRMSYSRFSDEKHY